MTITTQEDPSERASERKQMTERQLRRRGLWDERVLRAMAAVPRHRFVPQHLAPVAYDDGPLPIGDGQTISQPYMVARTCELAAVRPGDRVLDVGSGSGYQAAVLAELGARVIGIERVPQLAEAARERLRATGHAGVEIVCGDGTLGHPEAAPYDAIVVAAAARQVPKALVEQLAEGGRLVIPLGPRDLQFLTVLTKRGGRVHTREYDPCIFVPLVGAT